MFKQNTQVKLHKEAQKVFSSLTKPEQNNLFSITVGILRSGSCIMRQIAQNLRENISLEKTTDRFRVHLSKDHVYEKISRNFLIKESVKIKHDDLIVVDPSDIVKKYANKMEKLSGVRDGSTGKWENGYEVLDMIRVSESGIKHRLHPLVSELHSNNESPGSMKQAVFDRINDIMVYSENRGTYVMDRGYDDKVVFNYLHENEASYIVRSMGKRNLYFQGKEMNFNEVVRKAELTHIIQSGKAKLRSGVLRVGIPVDAHHRKHATLVYSNLVIAQYIIKDKYAKDCKGGFFYIFCDFPCQNLCESEIISKVLKSYRLRWKIEEYHRQAKNSYAWESMRLMTFTRLENLNCLLLIALSFIYSLDENILNLGLLFHQLIFDRKNVLKLPEFMYYRISLAIKELFKDWNLRKRHKFKGKYTQREQMSWC